MRTTHLLLTLLALLPGIRTVWADPPEPSDARASVLVEGDGFVRVKAASLRALGFIDAQLVDVVGPNGEAPILSPNVGDDIVFLAWGTARPHTRRAEYLITPGDPDPSRVGVIHASLAAGVSLPRDEARIERSDDTPAIHDPLAAAEQEVYGRAQRTWFRHRITSHGTLALTLPRGTVPGAPLVFGARLHTTQPGGVVLVARHAGREVIPTLVQHPQGGFQVTVALQEVDPAERLVLEDRTPAVPAPRNDVSEGRGAILVSELTWTGPVDVQQAEGLLTFEHTHRLLAVRGWPRAGWHVVTVGPSGERVGAPSVLASTPASPLGGIPPGMAVFQGYREGAGRVVLGPERVLEARSPRPLVDPIEDFDGLRANEVEHLILALPHLLPGARRLAAHRRAHGLASVALSWTDLRSDGDADVDPALVRATLQSWRRESSALRYVLLVGDATLDRVDLVATPTIPALMARTQYNGATPADTLYVEGDGEPETDPPVVGRLPFQDPAAMERFVDRLVAYETAPPRDASRRTLRFLASEGRFGALADAMIEQFFKRIVGYSVSPAYDVEVTFASQVSAFLWPPREFGPKVIESINQGALFYTYVGHGFAQGFDSLRIGDERFPILHLAEAEAIDIRGTPPVMIAIACTTAQFDDPRAPGLGETLLARPHGPIAYVGATRVCHPAGNAFLGRSIARAMFPPGGSSGAGGVRRLGEVLAAARREVLDPRNDDQGELALLTMGTRSMLPPGTSLTRLKHEAFWLYNLLGDPGTRLAVPDRALEVAATRAGEAVVVEVRGAAEGERVAITIELPRQKQHPFLPIERGLKAGDPAQAEAIRRNHRHANDKVVLRGEALTKDGVARLTLTPAPDTHPLGHAAYGGAYQVKAATLGAGPVGLGVALLLWEGVSSPDGVDSPPGATDTPK